MATTKVKLAELLLQRKFLNDKVQQTQGIKQADVFTLKMTRKQVSDSVDDITANVPKLTLSQVTAEHDHYSRALRRVDAAIQQQNWIVDVEIDPTALMTYEEYQASLPSATTAEKAE